MDGVGRARWRTLAGLAALCAMAVVLVLVPLLRDDEAAPTARTSTAPSEPRAPTAVTAAALDVQVTTGAAPLDLVEQAHTVVFAVDQRPTAAQAGMLALDLRAPLVLVPPHAASSMAPSAAASSSPTATSDSPTAAPSADPRAAAARAARERGVVRAVAVGGGGAAGIARDSGAVDVVEVPADPASSVTAGHVIRAAADHGAPADGPTDAPAGDGPSDATGDDPSASAAGASRSAPDLTRYRLPEAAPTGAAVLVRPRAADALATVVTARAAGHTVLPTRADDLRADPDVGAPLAELAEGDDPPPLLLAGDAFADAEPDALRMQAAVAMTGVELPGGGQLVFDPDDDAGRRYVGLYGVPQTPALGALGEQPVPRSVARAKRIARDYQRVVDDDVEIIPCFEIIATVASSSAGKDKDYSNELPVADLREAVDAAGEAGVYVLLDLQPGRTDFLTQAKRYRELLQEPHVGLALDPEWRLRAGERHLEQIGSVDVDEVNEVTAWLSDMVERRRLPQKMLLLHQFRLSMLQGRERLDTTRTGLAFVIQMDGQGPQGTKLDTWRAITADPPPGVHFGWKNFYDEDTPTRSPADTMALTPAPVFVSYQ